MKLPLKHSLKIQVPQSNMDQGCFLDLILKRASFLKEKKGDEKTPNVFLKLVCNFVLKNNTAQKINTM